MSHSPVPATNAVASLPQPKQHICSSYIHVISFLSAVRNQSLEPSEAWLLFWSSKPERHGPCSDSQHSFLRARGHPTSECAWKKAVAYHGIRMLPAGYPPSLSFPHRPGKLAPEPIVPCFQCENLARDLSHDPISSSRPSTSGVTNY